MKNRKVLRTIMALSLSLCAISTNGAFEANAAGNYDSTFNSISLAKGYKNLTDGNPCMTQRFSADPGAMEYNGRVYVYSTNDEFEYKNGQVSENTYSKIQTINCMSSDDMVNWTDHGKINVAGGNGAAKWAACSWAPAAAHKKINGKEKFFLYFANSGGGIGVLTSDSPTGPWTDPIGHALVTGATPNCRDVVWMFDPAVMVDSDGTGYLYFGGGVPNGQEANPKTARVVKLGNDMTSLAGTPQVIDAPYLFEDSGINKVGNTYYYTYCTNWNQRPNQWAPPVAQIGYMTSNSPMGPFTYKGTFLNNPGDYFNGLVSNNHHSIVTLNNKNYVFYHSMVLEKNMMGNTHGYRAAHVNEVNISNGQISHVNADLKGVSQLKNVNAYGNNEAETMAWQGGISINGQGNTAVDMNRGDWVGVSNVSFDSGAKSVSMKVASRSGAVIKICADSPTGPACGYVEVPNTGSNYTFKDVSASVSNLSGVKKLFFVASGDCAVDNWKFSKDGSATPTPNPDPNPNPNPNPNPDPTPEVTGQLPNGWYYIKNVHAQKYLTVRNDNGKANENVELVQGLGIKGQKWYLNNVGNGYITLKSALGEFMLDVANGLNNDGTNLGIYNAYGGDAQQFMLKSQKDSRTFVIATKVSNGSKALDDYEFKTDNGANICQWSCTGNNNQDWVFENAQN